MTRHGCCVSVVAGPALITGAGEAGNAKNAKNAKDAGNPVLPIQPLQPFPPSWNRDEWDVAVADGGVYRIFQDRDTDRWFVDAIVD